MSPRLVVFGLGNPGARYAPTRHNLGFRVVDRIADDRGAVRWTNEASYAAADVDIGSTRVELVKPKTFMNLSGVAVRAYVEERGVEPGEILVVVDDIALPLGRLRLRLRGSDGGHNGLKSLIAALGTTDFARLRLGVGPVPAEVDPAEFVLGPFPAEEHEVVDAMTVRAVQCVEVVARQDLDRAMNLFNAPAEPEEEGKQAGGKRVDPDAGV